MPIIASETGALAADSVAEIFTGAGNDVDAQLGAAQWTAGKLAEGGWFALASPNSGADLTLRDIQQVARVGGWFALASPGSGADLTLRDIQQIARVGGRFVIPQALSTTLLAGRWFELDESSLATGLTFPVDHGGDVVLPYAVPGTRVVDANGQPAGDLPDGEVDDFAFILPLLPASSASIGDRRLAELFAVFAATATGCADAVIGRSVDWVQTRQQFGQPLKAFQALRHHLADMHIAREEAWTCAVAAGEQPDRAAEWAWIAMQRAKTVLQTGIQVHGGIGFTWEAGIHHWLRHVLQLESLITRT